MAMPIARVTATTGSTLRGSGQTRYSRRVSPRARTGRGSGIADAAALVRRLPAAPAEATACTAKATAWAPDSTRLRTGPAGFRRRTGLEATISAVGLVA